jgi:plasmid stabilization system protein ParE
MTYKVVLLQLAEREIYEAAQFYQDEKEGLGLDFLDELEAAKQQLSKHPYHYSYISSDKIFRRLTLYRFPFQIIYEISGDTIVILSVHHDKRKPFQ